MASMVSYSFSVAFSSARGVYSVLQLISQWRSVVPLVSMNRSEVYGGGSESLFVDSLQNALHPKQRGLQSIHSSTQYPATSPVLDYPRRFFYSIDQGGMFQKFRKHIPSLFPWIEVCYSSQPNLLLGSHSLLSCSGVQQGDPLVLPSPSNT